MELEDIGYSDRLGWTKEQIPDGFEPGRVVSEHRERNIVKTTTGEYDAEITGNMRFAAQGRKDFPAVGDWVVLAVHDGDFAIIHKILPRFSVIKRQAVGQFGEIQVIASNIDCAFLVQAVDRDFNINRLERYLAVCYSSKVKPVIVLTKTDLADETRLKELIGQIRLRIENVPVISISNETQSGYDVLKAVIERGKTYCLLGSSGVGKSTLLNNLSCKTLMKTGAISESTLKGRHVTSHRELIILGNGGILIDNPGMREVGIIGLTGGPEPVFDKISVLSTKCRFKDCTHTSETGCAVLEAIETGELDNNSYQNYLKIEREKVHFETTVAERRKKEKVFGKVIKDYFKKDVKNKNK